jgi:hypothetical protein
MRVTKCAYRDKHRTHQAIEHIVFSVRKTSAEFEKTTGLDQRYLELELTETVVRRSFEVTSAIFQWP